MATCANASAAYRSCSSTAHRASLTPTPCSATTPGGARAAASHLIAAGHRRIAFLGGREAIHTALERRRGYPEALNKHDIAEDPELVRTDLYDAAEAHTATRELLLAPDPPTAILSAPNLLTLGTLAPSQRPARAEPSRTWASTTSSSASFLRWRADRRPRRGHPTARASVAHCGWPGSARGRAHLSPWPRWRTGR